MPQKKLVRAIGIDDGHFRSRIDSTTLLVGVIMRGNSLVEGIISTSVKVDGLDSTEKILSLIEKTKFKEQIRAVFLSGVNFAGFNIADIKKITKKLKVPVIVVFRREPRMQKIFKALQRFKDKKKRIKLFKNAGQIHYSGKIFFQCTCSKKEALELIKCFTSTSKLPEPIRIAHLIASGITLGESTKP